MRKLALLFFMPVFAGCHQAAVTGQDSSHIALSNDSQKVVVSGVDRSVLLELKQDSLSLAGFQRIMPVYRMPADTDMKDYQKEQPGVYQITDSLITFKPDTAFKKGQTYFARFYGHTTNNTFTQLAKNNGNLKAPQYTEAVFKF